MTINHKFVSQIEDSDNDEIVRPSDWNAALVGTVDLSNTTNSTTDVAVTGILPASNGGTGVSSYLTDESDVNLTDESDNPLECKAAASMDYSISPFTKGSILFTTAGGRITEDNSNFTWNANTYSLSVTGDITAGGSLIGSNLSGVNTGDQTTTGTANRITVTDGANDPVIDIASTYVGQTSINTLGIIGTGTWQAGQIQEFYGGTGQSTYITGDILYSSSTNTLSKLASVATGNALISGGVATAPSWGKIGLTTHVSGTLPVANGGTGQTSYTNGQLLIGNTTGNTLDKATLTGGVGVDITNGNGSITIATDGTQTLSTSEKTDNYTLLSTDQVIIFNITSAKVATLPDPTSNSGKTYDILNKYSSTNNLTFSRNIDGDGTFTLYPGEVVNIISDGVEYLVRA